MRIILSVQLKNPRDRELLMEEINLMGHVPHIKGETITVVIDGNFLGSHISLIGAMNGYEITQEEKENETQDDDRFEYGAGI